MTQEPKPEFATNRDGARVADAINGHLSHLRDTWKDPAEAAIATAYFNVEGYLLLADELESLGTVRMLLGAEPHNPERRVRELSTSPSPKRAERAILSKALEGHTRSLADDRNLLGFTLEADAAARRLIEWLDSGKVEVRRLEEGFLHGKAFIVTTNDEGVIAGSSNLTHGGLATNIELNLGQYQPHVVKRVSQWFDELWDEAQLFDLAAFYKERFEPHSPYLIYLRMLFERYGEELEKEAAGIAGIHLTKFQEDGLWRARRILEDRYGVLIADEVGLGKTFIAGELIRQTVEENRQRVLVVAPATLRDGPWRKFLSDNQLGVERISFDQLAADRQLNPESGEGSHLEHEAREYAMVVVDEAHNLRNPWTNRALAMRNLLAGKPPKELVLVTATPVNNSLWDLFNVLGYFIRNDAEFADAGIQSMRQHFQNAMALDPDDLSPEHLFDVLDAVAVRRTREFVKRYYPNDTLLIDGKRVPITFPKPRVTKVAYDLDQVFPGFFDRFAVALDGPVDAKVVEDGVLSLASYSPSRYRTDGEIEAYEVQLAGLLRSGMLKRFESSSYAFERTCRKMARSCEIFLEVLEDGYVATGKALRDWIATDSDDIEEFAESLDSGRDDFDDVSTYDVRALRDAVVGDRDLLLSFADEAATVSRDTDPKLAALTEELAAIAAAADEEGIGEEDTRDKRKVIVFTYFADTVDWIIEHLEAAFGADARLAAYQGRIMATSGTHGGKDDALYGFAPKTTDAPPGREDDLYDILVSTDVLAEGVNLQQARHVINYDLPWNPMRLVQRHGRIDRIGSPHAEVFIRCVFPDERLDDLLKLEERLHQKLKQAAATVGAGEVLPGSAQGEVVFSESREEIEKIRGGDATLFETGGTTKSALSGEEFRQELRAALEDAANAARLKALAWGSGSGMAVEGAHPGYVFCARVADHKRVQFRYVDLWEPDDVKIADDTLSCLANAKPPAGIDTLRELGEDAYIGAFDAWRIARDHIVERWNFAADPANLTAPVPKAMHDAADLVRGNRPDEMTVEAQEQLVESLLAPYPERVLKRVRRVLVSDADGSDKVRELVELAAEEGMRPPPPPEPLPEITADDVHLICWLSIVPARTTSARGA